MQQNQEIINALGKASFNNDIESVRNTLQIANDSGQITQIINGKYNNALRRNALMRASEKGNLDIVQLLLDNGARVNDVDSTGMTALMLAAEVGHLEVIKLLLSKGANINNKTTVGQPKNALEIATENGRNEVVDVLDKWDETKAMVPLKELNVLSGIDPSLFIDMKEFDKGKREGGKRRSKRRRTKGRKTKRRRTKRRKY